MTRSEAETKRRKAVEFLRRIGKDQDAERFEAMTPQEYAEHKGAELLENPFRRCSMARRRRTVAELEAEIADLQEQVDDLEGENETLQDQLDEVASIVAPEEVRKTRTKTRTDRSGGRAALA